MNDMHLGHTTETSSSTGHMSTLASVVHDNVTDSWLHMLFLIFRTITDSLCGTIGDGAARGTRRTDASPTALVPRRHVSTDTNSWFI
jgi:hypothetical protein